jgi:stage II sporulation protein GA (sporulation sigma-E factor processing peptidase)
VGLTVWLDLVVALNFTVDYLLLLGTNRLTGFPAGYRRSAWAAALGAVYSGMCLLPGFYFLGNSLWRLVSLTMMASISFGWNRSAWSRTGIFILLSMALGGIALGLGSAGIPMLVLAAAGVWFLCRVGFGGRIGREYLPVQIIVRDRKVDMIALRDTGNSLRDPITGEPAMVAGVRAARVLLDLESDQLRNPLEIVANSPGFRLIPYRAVGQPGGMLLGIKTETVVDGKRGRRVVAFAPEEIGRGEGYDALIS